MTTNAVDPAIVQRIFDHVDEERLVKLSIEAVNVPSPTGHELAMAQFMANQFEELALQTQLQEIESDRANAFGVLPGSGGGKTLMFNGHIDTSYTGREPWLRHVPGFQPDGFTQDGHLFGLGISNMKGSVCAYVEAVRAIQAAGIKMQGDVMIAAVAGEIEKSQWGDDFRGGEWRGYSAGSRYLVAHGGAADMCILGEPTEHKLVLGHYGSMWMSVSTHGPFVHSAFSGDRLNENAIVRMHAVYEAIMEWIPTWEAATEYKGKRGIVNLGAMSAGFPWRVSRTPHRAELFLDLRVPPTLPMAHARREALSFAAALRARFPDYGIEAEVYLTAPGAEIAPEHELVAALEASHRTVFGEAAEHDTAHWSSDAGVLSRYGVHTVNYGTASGLPSAEKGENLSIASLMNMVKVYALSAVQICGVVK